LGSPLPIFPRPRWHDLARIVSYKGNFWLAKSVDMKPQR
jgi:hypothetical protein